MTEQEYLDGIKKIHAESNKKQDELTIEYAFSKSSVTAGDIVESKHSIITVYKIQAAHCRFSPIPECVYIGVELTKLYKPRKDGRKSRVYQSDLIKVNKVAV